MMAKTTQTVLVLEGAAKLREALLQGLSDMGTIAHAAGTWEEAQALLDSVGSEVSLAILDPGLPGKPAEDAISSLPLSPMGSWPVFLTCEEPATPEQVAEAHRHGIIGYLHKQDDLEEILLRVNLYLEGRLATNHTSALRTRVLASVELRWDSPEGADLRIGLVRDVSRGGMLVSLVSPLAVGSTAQLSFQLPSRSTPIRCDGRLVWLQNGPGPSGATDVGIRFENLQPEDIEFLQRFVLGKLRASSGPIR